MELKLLGRIGLYTLALVVAGASGCGGQPEPGAATPTTVDPTVSRTEAPRRGPEPPLNVAEKNADHAESIEALEAIGYVSGSVPAQAVVSGVVAHDTDRAFQGLNLVNSSHEPHAVLMTMDGKPLHRWSRLIHDVWRAIDREPLTQWRRVRVTEDGDLFAIYSAGVGLIKIDKYSELIWEQKDNHHHDIEILDDGRILSLTRTAHLVPRVNKKAPILEDFIVIHAPDGTLLTKVSLLECSENSMYWPVFERIYRGTKVDGDIFHTNDVEMLDGRSATRNPAFAKGNVMVSIWVMNAVAVVDLEERSIVWLETGMWMHQHDPSMLDSGNILLFDNHGRKGQSQVIEFNPQTQLIEWIYPPLDNPDAHPLYSDTISTAQRLPNGNTLIVESNNGRAIEVTPDHEIVWEYRNPYRARNDQNLVANMPQVVRLPPDFPVDWADGATVENL